MCAWRAPWRSMVTQGMMTIFVVRRGFLAAGRPQAVVYGTWDEARHLACTAAGNVDSGAAFRGFRTTAEAQAYWIAAVGGAPWPSAVPAAAMRR